MAILDVSEIIFEMKETILNFELMLILIFNFNHNFKSRKYVVWHAIIEIQNNSRGLVYFIFFLAKTSRFL
jgi:hypothetical protein